MSYYAQNPASKGNFMAGAGGGGGGGGEIGAGAGGGSGTAEPGGVHARDIRAFFGGKAKAGEAKGGTEAGVVEGGTKAGGAEGGTAPRPAPVIDLTAVAAAAMAGPAAGAGSGAGAGAGAIDLTAAAAAGAGAGAGAGQWPCGACTYLNAAPTRRCGVCDAARPRACPPATAPPSTARASTSGGGGGGGGKLKVSEEQPLDDEGPAEELAFEVSGNTGRIFIHRHPHGGAGVHYGQTASGAEARAGSGGGKSGEVNGEGPAEEGWEYAGARLTASEFRAAEAGGAPAVQVRPHS